MANQINKEMKICENGKKTTINNSTKSNREMEKLNKNKTI